MKRRLTERDVTRIVGKVLNEQAQPNLVDCLKGITSPPQACKGTDAGACIKEIGRLVYNSDPKTVTVYGDAIKCLTTKLQK